VVLRMNYSALMHVQQQPDQRPCQQHLSDHQIAVTHLLRSLLLADLPCAKLNLLDGLCCSTGHNHPSAAHNLSAVKLRCHGSSVRILDEQLPRGSAT
jgi:hypothetical protein